MATTTPWGKSQQSSKVARGIMFYSTEGHGGYHLSKGRMDKMPAVLKALKTYAPTGWYEEDCDWVIVVLAFPECFEISQHLSAITTARRYLSDQLDVDAYVAAHPYRSH